MGPEVLRVVDLADEFAVGKKLESTMKAVRWDRVCERIKEQVDVPVPQVLEQIDVLVHVMEDAAGVVRPISQKTCAATQWSRLLQFQFHRFEEMGGVRRGSDVQA